MKNMAAILILSIFIISACTNPATPAASPTATTVVSAFTATVEPTNTFTPVVVTPNSTETPAPSTGPGNGTFEDPFLPILLEGKEVTIKTYDLPKVQVEIMGRIIWVNVSKNIYFYTPYTVNNITDFMLIEGSNPVDFSGVWHNQPGGKFEYAHIYQIYAPTTDDLRINQYWETYVDKLKDLGLRKNENYYPDQHEATYQKCKIMLGNSSIVETWSEVENQYFFSLCP